MTEDVQEMMKQCSGHGEPHPIVEFSVDRTRSSGLANSCRGWLADRRRITQRPGTRATVEDMRRIIGLMAKGGDCFPWGGARNRKGYAVLGGFGQNKNAHRIMWEYWHGVEIPPNHDVHHLCGRRWCINPYHLEMMTHSAHAALTARERREGRCISHLSSTVVPNLPPDSI